jgi:hypothetical protein
MNKLNLYNIINECSELNSSDLRYVIKEIDKKYNDKVIEKQQVIGLSLEKVTQSKGAKYQRYTIENVERIEINKVIPLLYDLLFKTYKFKRFSRNKVLFIKGINNNNTFKLTEEVYVSNIILKSEFVNLVNQKMIINLDNNNKPITVYQSFEITVWKESIYQQFTNLLKEELLNN